MNALIIGVLVWSFVHFIPTSARGFRQKLIDRLGEGAYKGVFAVTIVLSIVLIVIGWRSTPENYIYQLPAWTRPLGILLMLLSFILFGASAAKSSIKRVLRHPMLTAVIVWSVSHLLTNGTTRAIVLFGGLGLWAIVQIILSNRRDGEYTKPLAQGFTRELRGTAISLVIFAVVFALHPYFTGVSPIP